MATQLNFVGRKLETRRKKNQVLCTREKRRVRMILFFSHVMLNKLHMIKCGMSTMDVAIISLKKEAVRELWWIYYKQRTGDDKRLSVKENDDILVQIKKEVKRNFSVFYVPELKHNLLSIGQFLLWGFHVHFNEDMCKIKDKHDALITKVKMTQSKMFFLKRNSQIDSCMHTIIQDKTWLWHFRFGHLSFKTLLYV